MTAPASLLQDGAGTRLLAGPLADRLATMRAWYVGTLAEDDTVHGFRTAAGLAAPGKALQGWCAGTSAVVFGQWLGGLARLYHTTGDREALDKAVRMMRAWGETLPKITFGHYDYDKYAGGLVDLLVYGGVAEAGDLLAQLTRRAETGLGRDRVPASDEDSQGGFFNGQLEWYTLGENLHRAWWATGDQRYRDFAEVWRYPHFWEMFTGQRPLAPWGFHGYSHCNAVLSLATQSLVDGDARLADGVVAAHDFFVRTQCYATGGYGPGEKLMRPDGELGRSLVDEPNEKWLRWQVGRSFETPCGSWAVLKLCKHLLMQRGEARFGDWLERIVWNGLAASLPLRDHGLTFYYADYRLNGGSKTYHSSPLPCCSGTYILDLAELPDLVAFRRAEGLDLVLYLPSTVTWQADGVPLTLTVATRYPSDGTVRITVTCPRPASSTLRLRIPGWAAGARLTVAGESVVCTPGTWAVLARTWSDGDTVALDLPMTPRAEAIDSVHPQRIAWVSGPSVLVRTHEALTRATPRPDGDGFVLTAPTEGRYRHFWQVDHAVPYQMYQDLA